MTRDSGALTTFLTSLKFASCLDMTISLRLLTMITTTAAVTTSSSVMLYVFVFICFITISIILIRPLLVLTFYVVSLFRCLLRGGYV